MAQPIEGGRSERSRRAGTGRRAGALRPADRTGSASVGSGGFGRSGFSQCTARSGGSVQFDAARGASLYTTNCVACHQATGTGLTGAFPPLKGNAAVLDADPTTQVGTILNGAQGVQIGGVTYPSAMPPFGASLSDVDIADIANHERTTWGNQGKLVTADQVKAARAKRPAK